MILTFLFPILLLHCGSGRGDAPRTPLPPLITSQPRSQTVKAPAGATFSAAVSGDPAPTFQWSLNGVPIPGATGDTYGTPPTDSSMTGAVYTVTASNSLGTVVSAGAVLTVDGPPVITSQPGDITVRLGDKATFTAVAMCTGALTYQWSSRNGTIDGATGPAYTTPATTEDLNDLTYSVAVTRPGATSSDPGLTVTSRQAKLTVAWGPRITTQPVSQSVVTPGDATFTVKAAGNPLAYQWHRNGTPLAGATGDTLEVKGTTLAMDGDAYTVTVDCAGVSTTSDRAILHITGAPQILTQPLAQTVKVGSPFSLSVSAIGLPDVLTYQWNKDGAPIPGATSATYAVASASGGEKGDGGTYFVEVGNGVGTTRSAFVQVTVAGGYALSGKVTPAGADATAKGVEGVTLTLGTAPARKTVTDKDGAYAFADVPIGTWTLTPSLATASAAFLPVSAPVTVTNADRVADFTVLVGCTVSGVVHNPSSEPGTVYLTLAPSPAGPALGTARLAMAAGTAFAFKGVPPGTYTLSARADLYDKGVVDAHDPSGTLTENVVVANADVPGLDLTLAAAAPDLSLLSGPAFKVHPMKGGLVLDYQPVLKDGVEQPKFYEAEWSAEPDFDPLAGSRRFIPDAAHLLALTSGLLLDGESYYVRLRGVGPASATAYTAAPGPVTVGPETGGIAASGTATFTGAATDALVVGFRKPATGESWLTRFAAPASPQAFTLAGLPSGNLDLVAFLDQDGNGMPSLGEPGATQPVTLSGNAYDLAANLPGLPATASVIARHTRSADGVDHYTLVFTIKDGSRHAVSAVLASGPKAAVPASLGTGSGPSMTGEVTAISLPEAGDTYTIQVTYLDGSSETLAAQVTQVLGDLNPPGL